MERQPTTLKTSSQCESHVTRLWYNGCDRLMISFSKLYSFSVTWLRIGIKYIYIPGMRARLSEIFVENHQELTGQVFWQKCFLDLFPIVFGVGLFPFPKLAIWVRSAQGCWEIPFEYTKYLLYKICTLMFPGQSRDLESMGILTKFNRTKSAYRRTIHTTYTQIYW